MPVEQKQVIDIASTANKLLGFPSLRPGQGEAISSILAGRDTVVVQPTGSGKSAIYQIAGAMLRDCENGGSVIVVSPLIALQKDQADAIGASKLEEAAIVNSTLSAKEERETLARIREGEVEYILLAPEQLRKGETLELLKDAGVCLLAVDEAHCVSQWGHDFRPDYLQLAHVIEVLGHPPTLAMTATASEEVRDEIVARLQLNEPEVIVHGFDRPNISLRVDHYPDDGEKREELLRRVQFADTPGIVYTATREHAEQIANELQDRGVDALCYHGGLKAREREQIQDRFMCGETPVIVATNAFGMGVDKPDIRFVYHADASDSLDGYYQEIGRAGRDGKPAEAVLFYRSGDIGSQGYKTSASVKAEALEAVVTALNESDGPVSPKELGAATELSARKVLDVVHKLEDVGAAVQLASGEIEAGETMAPEAVTAAVEEKQRQLNELRRRRLEKMQAYAECRNCRRVELLSYFGDRCEGPCGNCDRCEAAGVRKGQQSAVGVGA